MEELFEKIERYIAGKLSGQELKDFEKELKENPELAEEVELHKKLDTVLGDRKLLQFQRKLEEVEETLQKESIPSKGETSKKTGSKPIQWIILAILAGLMGIYFGWVLPKQQAAVPPSKEDTLEDLTPQEDINTDDVLNNNQESLIDSVKTEDEALIPAEKTPTQEPTRSIEKIRKQLDPFQPNTTLETATSPDNWSNQYDFIDIEATVLPLSQDSFSLTIQGPLLAIKIPEEAGFLVEVFDNNPSNFPANPLIKGVLTTQEIDEETPQAFAAKKSFITSFDTIQPFKKGLYYYQIRLENDSKPLVTKKFKIS